MGTTDSFVVEDTGSLKKFETGMVRNSNAEKVRYDQVLRGPMFKRWAAHTWKAEKIYPDVRPGVSNWQLAETPEELDRAIESLMGHVVDFLDDIQAWRDRGQRAKEDHAAAIFFNTNLVESIREKIDAKAAPATKLPISHRLPGIPTGWIGK